MNERQLDELKSVIFGATGTVLAIISFSLGELGALMGQSLAIVAGGGLVALGYLYHPGVQDRIDAADAWLERVVSGFGDA